ncbi:MAG: nucleotidyltransferase substrate binding protein [Selenomonadaceae bacterium]|nr:nucleotidyltransferase substrate binding protein [Selenomonadaceae bacterium]
MDRLSELVDYEELSPIEKDALLRRFEICFEVMWRCANEYLHHYHYLYEASPKKTIRMFREIGIFNDEEMKKASDMTDDRNSIYEVYDEELANKLIEKIYDYEKLMKKWYNSMKNVTIHG